MHLLLISHFKWLTDSKYDIYKISFLLIRLTRIIIWPHCYSDEIYNLVVTIPQEVQRKPDVKVSQS